MPVPLLVSAAITVLTAAVQLPTKMPNVARAQHIAQELAAADEVKTGNLIIPLLNGKLVQDNAVGEANTFVSFRGTNAEGLSKEKTSSTQHNTNYPKWYEVFVFGISNWFTLEAQVFNQYWSVDEPISEVVTIHLTESSENCTAVIPTTGGGMVTFMYLVQ